MMSEEKIRELLMRYEFAADTAKDTLEAVIYLSKVGALLVVLEGG